MIYDVLEKKLVQNGFVPGVSLFRSYMPSMCSIGVMTRIPLTGIPIDPYIPGYYKGEIQVVLRHTDPKEGQAVMMRVQKLLTVEATEVHPATEEHGELSLDLFIPKTLPISFPQLDGNAYEWSQHFDCVFKTRV